MPLIQKQKRHVKRHLSVNLDESLIVRLNSYIQFLESSRDHVVSSILAYVMDRDKEFAAHLAANGQNSPKRGTATKPGSEE
jgi:hypothetical protein